GAMDTPRRALRMGFINTANKYLNAESFLFKVNATATCLRRKQVWTMEFLRSGTPFIYLKSFLKKYLEADTNGKITCDKDVPSQNATFLLIQHGDGKVSFQSEQSHRYLGGAEENILCFAETVTESEKWVIHLAIHPSVHIYCAGMKRYLRSDATGSALCCDTDLPWGPNCVLTLYFDLKEKKYGIRTGDGTLIASDGRLESYPSSRNLYSMELKDGMITLKDKEGRYMTGRENVVRTFKTEKPSQDELFLLESSPAQVSFRSASNGRYVSSTYLAAACMAAFEMTNLEIFQMIFDDVTKKACFRSINNTYLSVGAKDVIVAVPFQDETVWFALHYVGVKVCLLSPDRSGRYITVKPNGQLALGPTSPGRSEEFYLKLVNRPLLILESEFGFVASAPGMHRLDANRTSYEAIKTRALDSGYYHFQ
uniref:Fascin-like domain-containing protein n=1 Tax=Latimeria chalumnae TaxID=7897 RepID=H3A7Q2_LATCH